MSRLPSKKPRIVTECFRYRCGAAFLSSPKDSAFLRRMGFRTIDCALTGFLIDRDFEKRNSKLLLIISSKSELLSSVNSQSLQNRPSVIPLRLPLSRLFCTTDCPMTRRAALSGPGIFHYSSSDRKSGKNDVILFPDINNNDSNYIFICICIQRSLMI